MDEKKKRNNKILCISTGIVALLICLILIVVGRSKYLLVLRALFAGIAALSFAIKLGIEISCDEEIVNSILLICICLLIILLNAMRLA